MNFSPLLLGSILLILLVQSYDSKTVDESGEERAKLGVKIGWVIVKVPADIAKLLIWKAVRLPPYISRLVGVRHVLRAADFLTPKFVKKDLKRLKEKIPIHKWSFTLYPYVYTIATGNFGIRASKTKIFVPPRTSKFTKAVRKSKAGVSRAFRKSNVTKVFKQTKTKFNKLFETVRIPNGLKSYFRRLGKR